MRTTNMAIRYAALRRVNARINAMLNRHYLMASRRGDPSQNWDQIEVDIQDEMAEILLSLGTDIGISIAQAVDTYKQRK